MNVNFQYTSQMAMILGKEKETLNLPDNIQIQEAIQILIHNKSPNFIHMLFNLEGKFLPSVLIIKNGTQIDYNQKDYLHNNDEILFFSPMSGG